MSKKKKPFTLGKDVEAALRDIVSINSGAPAQTPAHAEPAPAEPAPVPPTPVPNDALLVWYTAMKPRVMYKFIWLVLFQWLSTRSNGVIDIDETAKLLDQKSEKVRDALKDLEKSGWLEVIDQQKGVRGRILSKTIRLVTNK